MKKSSKSAYLIRLFTLLSSGVASESSKILAGLGPEVVSSLDAVASPVQNAVAELVASLASARLSQRAMIALIDPEALPIDSNDLNEAMYDQIFLDIGRRGKVGVSAAESNTNRAAPMPIELFMAVYIAHCEAFDGRGGSVGWTRAKGRVTQLLRRYKQPVAQYDKWLTKHYITQALVDARSVTAEAEYPSVSEILALFEDGTI